MEGACTEAPRIRPRAHDVVSNERAMISRTTLPRQTKTDNTHQDVHQECVGSGYIALHDRHEHMCRATRFNHKRKRKHAKKQINRRALERLANTPSRKYPCSGRPRIHRGIHIKHYTHTHKHIRRKGDFWNLPTQRRGATSNTRGQAQLPTPEERRNFQHPRRGATSNTQGEAQLPTPKERRNFQHQRRGATSNTKGEAQLPTDVMGSSNECEARIARQLTQSKQDAEAHRRTQTYKDA
jgi:hypothetical protein